MRSVFLFVLLSFALIACQPKMDDGQREKMRQEVETAIGQAQQCKTREDCAPLGSPCPFGCNLAVDKTQTSHLLEMIHEYKTKTENFCSYNCPVPAGYACYKGRCIAEAQCVTDAQCQSLDCSRFDTLFKKGYTPACVLKKDIRKCECRCFNCE